MDDMSAHCRRFRNDLARASAAISQAALAAGAVMSSVDSYSHAVSQLFGVMFNERLAGQHRMTRVSDVCDLNHSHGAAALVGFAVASPARPVGLAFARGKTP